MKKTEPAGGCLGFVFGLCVILYVVFGMLWMFIKEHIGLICIVAIIIGVLWYRNKSKESEDTGFMIKIKENPKRFFGISPSNGENDIYVDLWTVYPYSDETTSYLAYQKVKCTDGKFYAKVYQIGCDDREERGLYFYKIFSLLYKIDYFDIDKFDTTSIYVQCEKNENRVDYFYADKSEVAIAKMPKDSTGHKQFFAKLKSMTTDQDFLNYNNKFDLERYESMKENFDKQ